MQSQPQNIYSFFKDQRFDDKNTISDGGDIMHIRNDFYKARGIRPWEKAKYENDIRRLKQKEFFDNQKKLQKMKNKNFESTEPNKKDKCEYDWDCSSLKINTNAIPVDFVGTGNDAWDD